MAISLVKAMLTEQMRYDEVHGREEAKAKLAEDLASRLGEEVVVEDVPDLQQFGHVDDYYVSFEWSEGGMIHAHMALWITGAPRIDKIEVPRAKSGDSGDGKTWVEIDVVPPGAEVAPQAAAATRLAIFWDRAFTEFNVAKAMAITEGQAGPQSTSSSSAGLGALAAEVGLRQAMGTKEERSVRSPESLSYEALAHCLLVGLELGSEDDARCWEELHGMKDAPVFRWGFCKMISPSQALLA